MIYKVHVDPMTNDVTLSREYTLVSGTAKALRALGRDLHISMGEKPASRWKKANFQRLKSGDYSGRVYGTRMHLCCAEFIRFLGLSTAPAKIELWYL